VRLGEGGEEYGSEVYLSSELEYLTYLRSRQRSLKGHSRRRVDY
jgi:hypothetical protein